MKKTNRESLANRWLDSLLIDAGSCYNLVAILTNKFNSCERVKNRNSKIGESELTGLPRVILANVNPLKFGVSVIHTHDLNLP